MILFKIFQQFLLPSTFGLIILIVGLILLMRNRSKKISFLMLLIGTMIYYIFSITPTVNLLSMPLINKYSQDDASGKSVHKMVVLTGSIQDRASEALRLYFQIKDQPSVQIIISGTSALNSSDNSQAEKTKHFLTERGVPEEIIVLETSSRNTYESAVNIQKLLGQEQFFLITSDYHLPRALLAFQMQGNRPIPTPAKFNSSDNGYNYDFIDFFPNPENLNKTNLLIHEYLGLIYYKFILKK